MDVKYREEIVKSVRDDYLDRREERRNFECQWQLNTNFVMGNQFSYVSPSGEIEDRGRDYFGRKEKFTIISRQLWKRGWQSLRECGLK